MREQTASRKQVLLQYLSGQRIYMNINVKIQSLIKSDGL